jgi:hypothetical protein
MTHGQFGHGGEDKHSWCSCLLSSLFRVNFVRMNVISREKYGGDGAHKLTHYSSFHNHEYTQVQMFVLLFFDQFQA